eukprot:523360-Lingulodinium_polyedra.AAC.1
MPLADALLTLLMARVLQDLRRAFTKAGFSMVMPERAATPLLSAHLDGACEAFPDVSYLDDF